MAKPKRNKSKDNDELVDIIYLSKPTEEVKQVDTVQVPRPLNNLNTMDDTQDLPVFKAIGFKKIKGLWYVLTLDIDEDKVTGISISEGDLKANAVETFKIQAVKHLFGDVE